MPKSPDERVLEHMRRAGVLRPRELDALGVPRVYLQRPAAVTAPSAQY